MISRTDRRFRFGEIDFLKAASILVVVFIHVYVTLWARGEAVWWIASITRFAVPAFFFAAGFLTSIGVSDPRRRAMRVLVPYVIASVIALVWRALAGTITLPRAAFELAMGGAVQPYYFVFDYILLVFLVPLFTVRGWILRVAILLTAAGAFASEMAWTVPYADPPLAPMFWRIRDPLRWAVYFLVGIETRRHISQIEAWPARARLAGGAVLAAAWLASLWGCLEMCQPGRTATFVMLEMFRTFCVIGSIVLLAPLRDPPTPVRWLSDATYPIYLYHLLILAFVQPMILEGVQPLWNLPNRPLRYALALGGSIAIVLLARRLLGSRAKTFVG